MKLKLLFTSIFAFVCNMAIGQLSEISGVRNVYIDEVLPYRLVFSNTLTTDTKFVISLENGLFDGTNEKSMVVTAKARASDFVFIVKWSSSPGNGKITSYKVEDSKKVELNVTIANRQDVSGFMINGPDIVQRGKEYEFSFYNSIIPTDLLSNPLWEVDNKFLTICRGLRENKAIICTSFGLGLTQIKLMVLDKDNKIQKTLTKSVEIVPGSISGNSYVCGEAIYSIADMPVDATMSWSVTNNKLIIVSGQGSSSVKMSAVAGASGPEKIKLTYTYKNQIFNCELNVEVGNPPIVRRISGPTNVPLDIAESYQADVNINSNEGVFVWQIIPSAGAELMQPNGNTCTITFRNPGNYMLTCMVKSNSCGYQTNPVPPVLYITVEGSYYNISQSYNTRTLTINQYESISENIVEHPVNYRINNLTTGMTVTNGKVLSSGGTIDISTIPDGVYVLSLETINGKIETHKIIKK